MRQSAFTVVTPVLPGADAALSGLLRRIGDDVVRDTRLGLAGFDRLHYASFSVVPAADDGHSLVFEGNVDGTPAAFLERLLATSAPGVDEVYRHCAGYPPVDGGGAGAALRYLRGHDVGASAFHVAWPGHTVDLVRREDRLRRFIQDLLDRPDQRHLREADAATVHRAVVEAVRGEPALGWALREEPLPFGVRRPWTVITLLAAPLVAGAVTVAAAAAGTGPHRRAARLALAALGTVTAGAAVELRRAERADDRRERDRPTDWQTVYAAWSRNLDQFQHREDTKGQNHLSSVATIKPGLLRQLTLRAVLTAVRLVAALSPARGQLGGIRSIHFARWAITRDRRHLLFLSNFDGSWESYLGDFIDLAAVGLTAVWTNTDNAVGFPRTEWLVRLGARDEARFKAFARYGMVPTLLWYSAYPDLSVANIANNRAIRTGLLRPGDGDGPQAWLRRL
ncbi:hypothetical protein SAMN06893096_102216 [Geodermatophilus pulveris]|uniref:Uncharacterized protein n=1 Tax=Geodermatophilus pulveris TaxID=1564159 RepID=A0A239C4B6_9ACTN|nr:hypothetical protein [Geodermatophilus pulveris]SNS14528.1 hypothetical protein SAMN06893096_102216 [Geodermatophilus pulveris]